MGDGITAPPSSSIPLQNAFHRHLFLPPNHRQIFHAGAKRCRLPPSSPLQLPPILRLSPAPNSPSPASPPPPAPLPSLQFPLSPALARKVFDVTPHSDLVSCSALISNYVPSGLTRETLLVFNKMQSLGIRSNEFTLPTLLEACLASSDLIAGTQIHAVVIVTVFDSDVFVANTLIVMYAGFGLLSDSR